MQKKNYFSGKLRLLNRTLKQWTKLHKTGAFAGLRKQKQQNFIHRIQKLQRQLTTWSTNDYVKPALVSASLALGLVITNPIQAQSFNPPVLQAFNVVIPAECCLPFFPSFADMDNDGDLDLIANNASEGMVYFENIGDAMNPNYDSGQESGLGLSISGEGYIASAIGDLDGDGDNDFLYSDLQTASEVFYIPNIGTAEIPLFNPELTETNPFNINFDISQGNSAPELVDLDQDGDLDLMLQIAFYGGFHYFENVGTPTEPNFGTAQINPFGLNSSEGFEVIAFGDIDDDGDIDLLTGLYEIKFYENIGDETTQFAEPIVNPFEIVINEDFHIHVPEILDIDGDGDLDIVAGFDDDSVEGEESGLSFFENISNPGTSLEEVDLNHLSLTPNPANNQMRLNIDETNESMDVSIYNMVGQLMLQKAKVFNGKIVDISTLATGVYLVKVKTNDKIFVQKFLVNNQ